MDYDDYNTFRATLAPASGFQSVQFRYIELYCTRLENLINDEGKKTHSDQPSIEEYFDHIYWKDAGMNRKNWVKKTLTLRQFEEKYLDGLISLAKKQQGKTIQDRLMELENPSNELKEKLREFDHLITM